MGDDSVRLRERHKSLYFTDGNVVLLAPRPDQPGLLFRVHKSVLSSYSPIFMDMFDVCNPSTGNSTCETEADNFYDGVPLIHMSDNANDLESLLKILYYQSTLPWVPRSPHYPELITPILELSRKYGIDRMREQIQEHLEHDWPQTLKDWDKLERDIEFMSDVRGRIDDYLPEPVAAIKLAREFEIPSILPAAFYHLSRLSILDDWDNTHADPLIRIRNSTNRTARWGLLSAMDFRCLLLGKAELAEKLRGYMDMGEIDHRIGMNLWKDIYDRCLQSADPLALLRSSVGCERDSCRIHRPGEQLRAKATKVRTKIWEKLGDLFHLEDK